MRTTNNGHESFEITEAQLAIAAAAHDAWRETLGIVPINFYELELGPQVAWIRATNAALAKYAELYSGAEDGEDSDEDEA